MKRKFIDALRKNKAKEVLSSRNKAKKVFDEKAKLAKSEIKKLQEIRKILEHEILHSLIDEGKITFAMIKPKVNEGKSLPADEDEAANIIHGEIGEAAVFRFAVKFNQKKAEEFYKNIKENLPQERWEDLMGFVTSGPLDVVLVHREERDAVSWWRGKIGPTNPQMADETTIRGKYGIHIGNNIVHGSNKPSEARREILIISKVIEERILLI